jgi:hypothetical protein
VVSLLLVSALTAATALAQDAKATHSVHVSSPYKRLFTVAPSEVIRKQTTTPKPGDSTHPPRPVKVSPRQQHTTDRGPCNMPIIVGDASADPGILIPRKHIDSPRIRVDDAPACQDK